MASYDEGPNSIETFGVNEYLATTHGLIFTSKTLGTASAAVLDEVIDGSTQRVLQPGLVLARVTAVTGEENKVGPYDTTATDGRQTAANIVGINDTFAPWELLRRDIPVAALVHGRVETAGCIYYLAGVKTVLSGALADTINALAHLDLSFE